MIERVHEHIINELGTNTRTDTIFVLTAIILNLITLGINSGLASSSRNDTTTIVMCWDNDFSPGERSNISHFFRVESS